MIVISEKLFERNKDSYIAMTKEGVYVCVVSKNGKEKILPVNLKRKVVR